MMNKIATGLLAIILSGCAFVPAQTVKLYAGEPKPETEVAALAYIWRPQNADGATVVESIDGKPFSSGPHVKAIFLSPGKHTFGIKYEKFQVLDYDKAQRTIANTTIESVLQAGHKYVIRSYVEGNSINFQASDLGKEYSIDCLNSLRWDNRRDTKDMFSHCTP